MPKKKKNYTSRSLKKRQREAQKKKEDQRKLSEAEQRRRRTGSSFDAEDLGQVNPIRSTGSPVVNINPVYIRRPMGKSVREADMYGRMGRILMNALLRMGYSRKAIERTMGLQEVEDRWSANDAEYLRVQNEKRRASQQAFLSKMPQQMALNEDEKKLGSTEQKKGRRDERSLDLGQRKRPMLEALTEEELPSKPKRRSTKTNLKAESPKEPKVNNLGSVEDFLKGEPEAAKEPKVNDLGSVEDFLKGEPETAQAPKVNDLGSVEDFLKGEPEAAQEPKVNDLGSVEDFLKGEPEAVQAPKIAKEPKVNDLGSVEDFLAGEPEAAQEPKIVQEPKVNNLGSVEEFLAGEPEGKGDAGAGDQSSVAQLRKEFEEKPEELYQVSEYSNADSLTTAERPALSLEEETNPMRSRELASKRRDSAQIAERMGNAKLLSSQNGVQDDETKELLDALRDAGMQGEVEIGRAIDEIIAYPVGEMVGSTDKHFAEGYGEYLRFREIRGVLQELLSRKGVIESLGGPMTRRVWEFIKREEDYNKLDEYVDARLQLMTTAFYAGSTMEEVGRWKEKMKDLLRRLGKEKLAEAVKGNPSARKALRVVTMIGNVERLEAACGGMVRAEEAEVEEELAGNGEIGNIPDNADVEQEVKEIEQNLDGLKEVAEEGEKLAEQNEEGELTDEDIAEIMKKPEAPQNDAQVDGELQELEGLVDQENAAEKEHLREIIRNRRKKSGVKNE